jgi:4a-hydroxytetrahydrobiopterin dehydratase
MRDPKLTEAEIFAQMQDLPEWSRDGDVLRRTFVHASFPEAIAFVVKVAFAAEKADHHPDVDIRWCRVTLALTTHDSGGLTARDFALARETGALSA